MSVHRPAMYPSSAGPCALLVETCAKSIMRMSGRRALLRPLPSWMNSRLEPMNEYVRLARNACNRVCGACRAPGSTQRQVERLAAPRLRTATRRMVFAGWDLGSSAWMLADGTRQNYSEARGRGTSLPVRTRQGGAGRTLSWAK